MAGLRKPTVCVPRVTRHATAWNPEALTFLEALRPRGFGASLNPGRGPYAEESVPSKLSRYQTPLRGRSIRRCTS